MKNLWSSNTPQNFWRIIEEISDDLWNEAIRLSLPKLQLPQQPEDIHHTLALVLGEEQFGADHWKINQKKKIYYHLKPLIPRFLSKIMRNIYSGKIATHFPLGFPIEERYTQFLYSVIANLFELTNKSKFSFIHFWKYGKQSAFVLTHDIETKQGQDFVPFLADLEQRLGFRSLFNFIPERYPLDEELIIDLLSRGFEVGLHGLKHDGKLFFSEAIFKERANKINSYIKKYHMKGFRSPLTHRNPYWMQALDIEYDLSFFDTDPYEPIPGGTMSIFPFMVGKIVELPYTLMQDYTYINLLRYTSIQQWMEKVTYLQDNSGLILINTHPDYLKTNHSLKLYSDFLHRMKEKADTYWHALPHEIAAWWKARMTVSSHTALPESKLGILEKQDKDTIRIHI